MENSTIEEIDYSEFKNNSKRAKNAITIFWVICILNAFNIVINYLHYTIPFTLPFQIEMLLRPMVYMTSVLLFLMWFYRAHKNLHVLKVHGLNYGKNASIWYFFIPLANLVIPYHITVEIFEETQEKIRQSRKDFKINWDSNFIGIWWGLFIITKLIDSAFRDKVSLTNTELSIFSNPIIYYDVVSILASIATALVIRKIMKVEDVLREVVHEQAFLKPIQTEDKVTDLNKD